MAAQPEIRYSACPHDCPSTCALEVERLGDRLIGKVRGARENSYTAGVVCSKVARYAERIHHPDRLTTPLRRVGDKGSRESFVPVSWDDALDIVAESLLKAEQRHGSETVWPYYYAGTMGLVMRDGINRLRHVKRYSGQYNTVCVTLAWNGFIAGTGRLAGADPREMANSDLVVIWGTNAAATQVNVMTHALEARRRRDAPIVVVDTYRNATAKQADLFVCVRPGTDGALACAVMHVLFRDGHANREYLARYTDCPGDLERHLADRTPQWAERITGVPVDTIETLARMIGTTPRTYLRLGYGFCRQRNGAVNMHAALSIAAVTGAWLHEGGGAFHNSGDIYHWDKSMIEAHDAIDPSIRVFDQSRIGPILDGDRRDLADGPPVTALFIQNTNPMMIAPELERVHRGFARDDLFTCVHEQFMTETAAVADVVLPATMFLEHDDVYQSGGHQHIILGPKIVEPPGGCRSNHEVVCELAKRLGAHHPGFEMTPRELIDHTLRASGWEGGRPARGGALVRLSAGFRRFPLQGRLCAPGREVPVLPRLGGARARWIRRRRAARCDAPPSRPLGGHRGGDRGDAVPHGDRAGAALSQLVLHRDPDLDPPRAPSERDDPPRGCDVARSARRRPGASRQRPRRSGHPRRAVQRSAARRGHRREHLAQPRVRGRQGHQRAHRRGRGGPGGRVRVPRQPDLDSGRRRRGRAGACRSRRRHHGHDRQGVEPVRVHVDDGGQAELADVRCSILARCKPMWR